MIVLSEAETFVKLAASVNSSSGLDFGNAAKLILDTS